MQKDSNVYTLGFATVMVVLVALLLSGLATGLKPLQDKAVELDNKFNILKSVQPEVTKVTADADFEKSVKSYLVSRSGTASEVTGKEAFAVNLYKEYKKADGDQRLPMYTYENDKGATTYIVPLHGNGLWDFIGGYLAVNADFNTIDGAVFTHVGETPGLGAEISKDWFQNNFKGEKLMENQKFVGVAVKKGKQKADAMHLVDGISGATITGDGVQLMIDKCMGAYLPYFKSSNKKRS